MAADCAEERYVSTSVRRLVDHASCLIREVLRIHAPDLKPPASLSRLSLLAVLTDTVRRDRLPCNRDPADGEAEVRRQYMGVLKEVDFLRSLAGVGPVPSGDWIFLLNRVVDFCPAWRRARTVPEFEAWATALTDVLTEFDVIGARVCELDPDLDRLACPSAPPTEPPAAGTPEVGNGSPTPAGCGLEQLPPSRQVAYAQYLEALCRNPEFGEAATDEQVYGWYEEHGEDRQDGLPSCETWSRYVREARRVLGTSKHTSRSGREGGSVVRPNEVERTTGQKPDK
jgi:hypothetical protein